MTRQQLLNSLKETFAKGIALVEIKNKDYAVNDDAFKNFKSSEVAGVSSPRAILIRVLDKISRISNLIRKPNSVKDESVTDTIIDCINYLAILKAYLDENGGEKNV